MPRSFEREMAERGYSVAATRDLADLWADRFGAEPVALADLLASDLRRVLVRAAGEVHRARSVRTAEDRRIAALLDFLAGSGLPRGEGAPPAVLLRAPGDDPAYALRETVAA